MGSNGNEVMEKSVARGRDDKMSTIILGNDMGEEKKTKLGKLISINNIKNDIGFDIDNGNESEIQIAGIPNIVNNILDNVLKDKSIAEKVEKQGRVELVGRKEKIKDEAENSIKRQQEEFEKLLRDHKKCEDNLRILEEELKRKDTEKEVEINQYKALYEKAEIELREKEFDSKEMEKLKSEINRLVKENTDLNVMREQFEQKQEMILREKKKLESEKEQLSEQIKIKTEEMEALKTQIGDILKNKDNEIKELQNKIRKYGELEKEHAEMTKRLGEYKNQLDMINNEKVLLKQSFDSNLTKLSTIEHVLLKTMRKNKLLYIATALQGAGLLGGGLAILLNKL